VKDKSQVHVTDRRGEWKGKEMKVVNCLSFQFINRWSFVSNHQDLFNEILGILKGEKIMNRLNLRSDTVGSENTQESSTEISGIHGNMKMRRKEKS